MYADEHRNQYAIFLSSGLSSIISTLITNPIEVAKTNIQYYPTTCQYYPHQSTFVLIKALDNWSHAAAPLSQSRAQLRVSKLYCHRSLYRIFFICSCMKIGCSISRIRWIIACSRQRFWVSWLPEPLCRHLCFHWRFWGSDLATISSLKGLWLISRGLRLRWWGIFLTPSYSGLPSKT